MASRKDPRWLSDERLAQLDLRATLCVCSGDPPCSCESPTCAELRSMVAEVRFWREANENEIRMQEEDHARGLLHWMDRVKVGRASGIKEYVTRGRSCVTLDGKIIADFPMDDQAKEVADRLVDALADDHMTREAAKRGRDA